MHVNNLFQNGLNIMLNEFIFYLNFYEFHFTLIHVECNKPVVANGYWLSRDLNCGTMAIVLCKPGYTPTPSTITCQSGGSFDNAICVPAREYD